MREQRKRAESGKRVWSWRHQLQRLNWLRPGNCIFWISDAAHCIFFSIWRCMYWKVVWFLHVFYSDNFWSLYLFALRDLSHVKIVTTHVAVQRDSESFSCSNALARRREKLIRTFAAFWEEIILIIKNASHCEWRYIRCYAVYQGKVTMD